MYGTWTVPVIYNVPVLTYTNYAFAWHVYYFLRPYRQVETLR